MLPIPPSYFVLPTCTVPDMPRSKSMSISVASGPFYPEQTAKCVNAVDFWRAIPRTQTPASPTYMLVRDPIERFLSALNVYYLDLESAMAKLPVLACNDLHFVPQTTWQYTQAFSYAQEDAFCAATGLPALTVENASNVTPPTLTASQTAILQQVYASDIALLASLTPSSAAGASN